MDGGQAEGKSPKGLLHLPHRGLSTFIPSQAHWNVGGGVMVLGTPVTRGTPVGGSLLCALLVPKLWHMIGLQLSAKDMMLRPTWEHQEVPGGSLEIVG